MARQSSTPKSRIINDNRGTGQAPELYIYISRERIKWSVPQKKQHCAITQEIEELCPWLTRVETDESEIRATDGEHGIRFVWPTPRVAAQFITRFDAGSQHLNPFDFLLNVTLRTMPIRKAAPRTRRQNDRARDRQAERQRSREDRARQAANREQMHFGGYREAADDWPRTDRKEGDEDFTPDGTETPRNDDRPKRRTLRIWGANQWD